MHLVTVFAKGVGLIAWLVPGSSTGLIPQGLHELHVIRFLIAFNQNSLIGIGFILRILIYSVAAFLCNLHRASWMGVAS